ncbi:tautomerase family protein [Nocardia alni]|uniref:tautomerase family protein n=1 Tax=Nocardia alni TaxID=2815723 RepID=UPI001C214964|nr:tautomerase family protein [Nocardia alni]
MPFIRIDALHADSERLEALGRAVHEAMIATIGIPVDDRFQVLTSHDGSRSTLRHDPSFLGIDHDDMVFVAITLRGGRTPEQKKALYRRIADLAHQYAGVEPRNVLITLTENEPLDWSFGNGVAQYAEQEPVR